MTDWDVGGLQIIDVSNVANPTLAGSRDTPGHADGVTSSGNYAYVADGTFGLQIIDVSNVTNPTFVGSCDAPGSAVDVALSGNYAYVADWDSGLQIIDWNVSGPCPTTSENLSSSSSGDFPYLWVGLIGGGLFCLCLVGGTTYILRRKLTSSNHANKLPEQGSAVPAENDAMSLNLKENDEKSLRKEVLQDTDFQKEKPSTGTAEQGLRSSNHNFELDPTIERGHKKIGGAYYQLSTIMKKEAEEIYENTGHVIAFPKGKKKLRYVIGKGNFGAIKVAQRIEDGKYVASKKVKGEENMRASEEEANMQREAAGDNILPIYNTINFSTAIYHFMPLAGYGNAREIQDQLSLSNDPKLVTKIIKFVAEDILTGLETIHEKNIYHLDIKPENIVFTKDGTGYITDFGCAKKARAKHKQLSYKVNGDNRYFSPVRLQASKGKNTFDPEKADLWATGIMLLQMLKDVSPLELFDLPQDFDARVELCTPDYFQEKINQFQELQKPKEGSIWSLIKNLLAPEEICFTAEQALEGAYFSGRSSLSKASIFKELRKEMLIQGTGISRDKFKDNYKNISDSMPPEGMKRKGFYQSEDHRKHYRVRFGGGGGL